MEDSAQDVWTRYTDEVSGKDFFHNEFTDETVWTLPVGAEIKPEISGQSETVAQFQRQQWEQKRRTSLQTQAIGDWKVYFDADSGNSFYYNELTRESRWTLPEDVEAVDASAPEEVKNQSESIDSWNTHKDENGNLYYYNTKTGETSWSKPTENETNPEATPEPSSQQWANKRRKSIARDLIGNWRVYTDPTSGNIFYHNEETDETSWTLPDSATAESQPDNWAQRRRESIPRQKFGAWRAYVDPESGNMFYHNEETDETSWTLPDTAADPTITDAESAEKATSDVSGTSAQWAKKRRSSISRQKIGNWRAYTDTVSGNVFYHNEETDESSWTLPDATSASSTIASRSTETKPVGSTVFSEAGLDVAGSRTRKMILLQKQVQSMALEISRLKSQLSDRERTIFHLGYKNRALYQGVLQLRENLEVAQHRARSAEHILLFGEL